MFRRVFRISQGEVNKLHWQFNDVVLPLEIVADWRLLFESKISRPVAAGLEPRAPCSQQIAGHLTSQ